MPPAGRGAQRGAAPHFAASVRRGSPSPAEAAAPRRAPSGTAQTPPRPPPHRPPAPNTPLRVHREPNKRHRARYGGVRDGGAGHTEGEAEPSRGRAVSIAPGHRWSTAGAPLAEGPYLQSLRTLHTRRFGRRTSRGRNRSPQVHPATGRGDSGVIKAEEPRRCGPRADFFSSSIFFKSRNANQFTLMRSEI